MSSFVRATALDMDTIFEDDFTASQIAHSNQATRIQIVGEKTRHGRVFRDTVHGHIRLDPVCSDIIDTPQFQRLRELKQLGVSYYVFPTASHNRFEHSLGVAHLANQFATHIYTGQQREVDIDRGDIKLAQVAGLCHDLGHGPLSHVFEKEFLRKRGIQGWSHEVMSAEIFDTILEDGNVADDDLSADEARRVKDMILAGHGGSNAPKGKQWLWEIVANGRNGLDVDKFDYLKRDSHFCGVPVAVDLDRLQTYNKVIDDEVCWKWSEYETVLDVFNTRASLHRRIYGHRKAKAVEFMLVDALLAADPLLRISDRIWDARQFVRLDDSLLKVIEHWDLTHPDWRAAEGSAAIEAAQAIIARVRNRDLYKYCEEVVVPSEAVAAGRWAAPTPGDIAAHAECGGVPLFEDDIILSETSVDLTNGPNNPLDRVHFYDDKYPGSKFLIPQQQFGLMMLETFQEQRLRVYSKRSDPAYKEAVSAAFRRWLGKRFDSKVVCCTPQRPAPPTLSLEDRTKRRKLF